LVAQSVGSAQVVRQAVALSHAYPLLQGATFCMHAPAALQADVVSIAAEQVVSPHFVPAG
jgi:hypothetical protein